MTKLDVQHTLLNYTPANASPVEANFSRVEQHVNQELIERDGTVAMRAQLRLVGDPVADLDAAPKQYVDQVIPVGIAMLYGGGSAPPGGRWAVCNGAELETATYPALFAVLGNTYSPSGTPAGRFHLPNLVDKFAMGAGTVAALGTTGGRLDTALPAHGHVLPSHSHGVAITSSVQSANHVHYGTTETAGGHAHTPLEGGLFIVQRGDAVVSLTYPGAGLGFVSPSITSTDGVHSHTFTTSVDSDVHAHLVSGTTNASGDLAVTSVGESPANQNLPPYVGLTYVMRVS